MNTTNDLSTALEHALLERIEAARYDLWFRDKTKFSLEGTRLVVGVSNLHVLDWLQKKFSDELRAAAQQVTGEPAIVVFVVDPELFQSSQRRSNEAPRPTAAAPASKLAPDSPADKPESIRRPGRRLRRLEDFVVGSCNRVAHAAALAVVEEPGLVPIPMVLHGPVGSGKSHLLDGIHAGLKERFADARILHLTAEDFTNRFLAAMHQNKQPSFRRQFRECDVLLIDDLQFLAKKPATQVEFLHTLETLQREGRTVVVTCDCHPRLAEIFQPELTDRLVGGAVHGLAWPDPTSRRAILSAKSGARLPDDVLDLMSQRLRGNVRELEGAVHSLVHAARVHDQPISLELAQETLAEVLRASVRTVGLADVDRAVVAALDLDTGALQSRQRTAQLSAARMLAMYLARKHTAATYSEVGQFFGKRSHSTAVAAEKRVQLWLAEPEPVLVGMRKANVRDTLERIETELAR